METPSLETCWTLIQAVHRGEGTAREDFARRYQAPVRAYLRARWRSGPLASEVEDAAQEVFLRCFSETGPLERFDRARSSGFRAFLYGVSRNVAREHEKARQRRADPGGESLEPVVEDDARLSKAFDRAFAQQVLREARDRYRERCRTAGAEAERRFQLLGLRFEQDLPIREIARRWGEDPARTHKEYARARREFRDALLEVVGEQSPGRTQAELLEAAGDLLALLG